MTEKDLIIQQQRAELKKVKSELNLLLGFISWQGMDSAWAAWKDSAKSGASEADGGVRT